MRTLLKAVGVLVVSVMVAIGVTFAALVATGDGGRLALPVRHTESFDAEGIDLAPLRVVGNELQDHSGAVVLQGVMVPDPLVLAHDGELRRDLVTELHDAGADVVRIPIHPEHWLVDPDYLWRYLDPLVRWCGEAGMYVILDWHGIGNVVTGSGPEAVAFDWDRTRQFWGAVAGYFADTPHVMFEIFNEPQDIAPADWRAASSSLVRLIRNQGADQVVIVGGTDYGRDLSWVLDSPVEDPAVVYASHIYPSHAASDWDTWFGDLAREHPVLVTEWGFIAGEAGSEHEYLVGDVADYGQPLLDYLADRGTGWVACWWDDEWQPAMFTEQMRSQTPYGRFVLEALR